MKFLKRFAIFIIIFGLILVIWAIIASKGNFSGFTNIFNRDEDYEKVIKNGDEEVASVKVDASTRNVYFSLSDDETYNIEYYESDYDYFVFSIDEGLLSLENKHRKIIFHWGYTSKEKNNIHIYLPKSFSGQINCIVSTGEIEILNFSNLKKMYLESSTGDINVKDCTLSESLEIEVSTGDIEISNIVVPRLTARSSTGEIQIKMLECSFLQVNTSTGSVKVSILGNALDYSLDLETSTGNIEYQNQRVSKTYRVQTGNKTVKLKTSTGDIELNIN